MLNCFHSFVCSLRGFLCLERQNYFTYSTQKDINKRARKMTVKFRQVTSITGFVDDLNLYLFKMFMCAKRHEIFTLHHGRIIVYAFLLSLFHFNALVAQIGELFFFAFRVLLKCFYLYRSQVPSTSSSLYFKRV